MTSKSDSASQRGNAALIYAQEGFTLKYAIALYEDTYFGILFSLQEVIKDRKLVRPNVVYNFFCCVFDFLHIIPFLVHGKILSKNL